MKSDKIELQLYAESDASFLGEDDAYQQDLNDELDGKAEVHLLLCPQNFITGQLVFGLCVCGKKTPLIWQKP